MTIQEPFPRSSTPFIPIESCGSDAIMLKKAECIGRELVTNMVDSAGDIYNVLFEELISERPALKDVLWRDIVKKLRNESWTTWLGNRSQENLDKLLQNLSSILYGHLNDSITGLPSKKIQFLGNRSKKTSALGNTSLYPPKPDFVTVEESAVETDGWRHYETIWEHKTSDNQKEWDDTICKVMVRGVQAFRDCPLRRIIFIVLVQGTKLRLIIADPSGGCQFRQINILQETVKFVQFIASILFLSRPHLGYGDANIPKEKLPIFLSCGGFRLRLNEEPLSYPMRNHLVGRGTHVYSATPQDMPQSSETFLVVKECWQPVDREKEEDILQGLEGVPGVPQLLYNAGSDPWDTTMKVRRDFSDFVQYRFTQQGYSEARRSSKFGTSGSNSLGSSSNFGNAEDGKRKSNEDSSGPLRKRSRRDCSPYRFVPRRHCQFVIPYCGVRLDATHHSDGVVLTDVERLRATRDILNTIKDAFLHHKSTLHKDISMGNIAVWRPNRQHPHMVNNGRYGFLLDWDLSKTLDTDWKPLWPPSGVERTGTWYYMATCICAEDYDGVHLPWYDAESVFWIWLIMLIKREGYQKETMEKLEAASDLISMSLIRQYFVSEEFWLKFMERSKFHSSLKTLLSEIRLELFFDQGRGPLFKYSTAKWSRVKENVRGRLECLAGHFDKCAAELDVISE